MSVAHSYTLEIISAMRECVGAAKIWQSELLAQNPKLSGCPVPLVDWDDEYPEADCDLIISSGYDQAKWPWRMKMGIHDGWTTGVDVVAVLEKIICTYPTAIVIFNESYGVDNCKTEVLFKAGPVAHLTIGDWS
jgi:hypothetical protein